MNASQDTSLGQVDQERSSLLVAVESKRAAAEPCAFVTEFAQQHEDTLQQHTQPDPIGFRKETETESSTVAIIELSKLQCQVETTKPRAGKKRKRLQEDEHEFNVLPSKDKNIIPPGDEGVSKIEGTDVLCGRGGGTNVHPGNKHFRDLIEIHRRSYLLARRHQKPKITSTIVNAIRKSNGRFLKKGRDGLWYEIGDEEAREKASQALRQRAKEMRKKLFPQPNNHHETGVPKQEQQQNVFANQQQQQGHQQHQQEQHLRQQMQMQIQLQQQQLGHQPLQMAFTSVPVNPAALVLLHPMVVQQAAAIGDPRFNPHSVLVMNNTGSAVASTPQQTSVNVALPVSIQVPAPQGATATQLIHATLGEEGLTDQSMLPSQHPINPPPSDSTSSPPAVAQRSFGGARHTRHKK